MRIIRYLLTAVVGITILVSVSVTLLIKSTPDFGKAPSEQDQVRFSMSKQYEVDHFVNEIPTHTGNFIKALKEVPKMFDTSGNPSSPIPTDFSKVGQNLADSSLRITWFGHSAFLIEDTSLRVLIDPMLSEYASPFSFGTKRFAYTDPIPIERIKNIDIVLISHDHYDHLDYESIQQLNDEVNTFIVPLGVGSHLQYWGVSADKIIEKDWWESHKMDELVITATPARHFSGRSLTDRDATLWAGWSIQWGATHIFFSGDGGYGPHFKEIAQKLPLVDLALLECGQYNQAWADIHMIPEETVQAAIDLGAKYSMPIHWGAFRLAPHVWDDPIQRFTTEANLLDVPYFIPRIGVAFELESYKTENGGDIVIRVNDYMYFLPYKLGKRH